MLRCLVLLALLWVARASTEPREGLRVVDPAKEKATSSELSSNSSPVDRERFFFGAYSTLSHTLVSFTTSTVYASCLKGFSTGPGPDFTTARCTGKRRKRWARGPKTFQIKRTSGGDDLSSSQEEKLTDTELEEDANVGDAKKFFTVWTKSITTTTLTSYSTNTATTISLSYYCSAGYIDVPFIKC